MIQQLNYLRGYNDLTSMSIVNLRGNNSLGGGSFVRVSYTYRSSSLELSLLLLLLEFINLYYLLLITRHFREIYLNTISINLRIINN